jgi:hypothetical protein
MVLKMCELVLTNDSAGLYLSGGLSPSITPFSHLCAFKIICSADMSIQCRTPISYKGTDYLQVDLSTRLIYNVTSSSDLLNYYIQLGDDVIKSMMK